MKAVKVMCINRDCLRLKTGRSVRPDEAKLDDRQLVDVQDSEVWKLRLIRSAEADSSYLRTNIAERPLLEGILRGIRSRGDVYQKAGDSNLRRK